MTAAAETVLPATPARTAPRSKTLAAWLAALLGGLGLHRFYLFGSRDLWAWLHPWPTLLGLYGVHRALRLGQDDALSWALIPVLGLMIAATMLTAIVYGLMPDERWDRRFNAGRRTKPSGWGAVLAAVVSLFVGATVLMATIAYGGQRFFEYQVEEARKISQ
jgi:hypothetical protein